MTAAVPFAPARLFDTDREALRRLVHEVGTDPAQRFVLGPRTAELERALIERTGAADVVACGSGTGALLLALHALGIDAGDEVIVPAFAFPSVASTVLELGATPVFADVDPRLMVLDPVDTQARITTRTRAVMPAHLFSGMADMRPFRQLGRKHGIAVVEDAAVAQGATFAGVPAGRWGDLGVYSFFPAKPFGGIGEGGVVLTDDPERGRRVRLLRDHGQDGSRVSELLGHSSRFDEVVAAFQLHRLPTLTARLARRAAIADRYAERFAPLAGRGVLAPPVGRDGRCLYVYPVLAERRDALRDHLAARGVGTRIYNPVPLPRLPAFAECVPAGDGWPVSERLGRQNLALPLWPGMTDEDVDRVTDAVCEFAEQE